MLHPTLLALLEQDRAKPGPPLADVPIAQAREAFGAMVRSINIAGPDMAHVEDRAIPVTGGSIPLRIYRPANLTTQFAPMTLFFHGGGWVFGDLDSHDTMCRQIAQGSGTTVVSAGYRLAPESKFPGPVHDCCTAYTWLLEHHAELGGNGRIALAGDSAGGNLALAVAIMAIRQSLPAPDFMLLIYPVTDLRGGTPSRTEFGKGYWLDNIDYQTECYVRSDADRLDPLGSPSLFTELGRLPPSLIVTAGFDPLRDEAEDLGKAINAAGGSARIVRHSEYLHGFLSLPGLVPEVAQILQSHAETLGNALRAAKA